MAFVRALPDHALLDRIIRGRAWIPLLGVLLAGIVAMQVEVLKLNAGIGSSLERGTTLQSQNELLRARVAALADDQRIERMAATMGMVMPAPQSIKFLSLGRSAALARALAGIRQPDAGTFTSALAASAGVTAAGGPSGPGTAATAATAATAGGTVPTAAAPSDTSSTGASSSGVSSTGTSSTGTPAVVPPATASSTGTPAAVAPPATTSSSTGT